MVRRHVRAKRYEPPRTSHRGPTPNHKAGPYANAVLRFYISFPDVYPRHPPLVTFSTDIFHPLVSPLSNYTFAADAQDNGAISASTEPRLPPGGFSLRHGFPGWFPRRAPTAGNPPQTPPRTASSAASTPHSKPTPAGETPGYMRVEEDVSAYDLLEYIRSAFAEEEVLDAVDVEASGDTGAWYAWRTHRRAAGKVFDNDGGEGKIEAAPVGHPSNWDWAGVWEDRVTKGIAASLSEAVLYGGVGSADDVVSGAYLQMPFHNADILCRLGSRRWRRATWTRSRGTSSGRSRHRREGGNRGSAKWARARCFRPAAPGGKRDPGVRWPPARLQPGIYSGAPAVLSQPLPSCDREVANPKR